MDNGPCLSRRITGSTIEPVAGAMETATVEKEEPGTTATATGVKRDVQDLVADSSPHQASTDHHHSSMINGKTGTNDIHDYNNNHQQQGRHQLQQQQQQQHNPEATIDTGYYADIVQQPVRVRCSEHYSDGAVSYPIEPCIAVQLHRKIQPDILGSSHNTIQNTSLLVARAYLISSDGCSDRSYFVRPLETEVQKQVTPNHPLSKPEVMEQHHLLLQKQLHDSQQHQQQHQQQQHQQQQHIPHNQHFVPLSPKYKYPSSPFRRPQNTQAIQSDPSTPLANTLYPLQQSPISTSNRGSTHSSSPCPLPGINTLASLDFKTSHHPQPLSHEAPNSTDPADADHCPNSKRSVWTDITHRVFQSPLPSVPTPSLFGSQTTAADIATGEDGNRGVFFFFPDIGIRVPGQFKLRIVISRMPQE
ncbi:hypothetical protein BASA50_005699 [Batrachochytrium salamandrivorans]|uniref:Velvet domain-containing protein n=1 Tax=Batrachochytrium salamandrivorans TaxID=1357716 RepID=A0ABQ8FC05_9FUNG|nr:hypothetical protein BASA50_005695 [Batrachochytrium salamandrivorans]KAH6595618.1 hypothetical protein BASA50_005699 [Batrachochytrium salamandrivorans]KAH9264543.1 hypothetical protein BASA83_011944 [Batrachochytrium salamandrivorans]